MIIEDCKHCEHYVTDACGDKVCAFDGDCENYVQTNEEWFCNLSTEEKATFLASNKMLNFDYQMWIEWLKEKHNGR